MYSYFYSVLWCIFSFPLRLPFWTMNYWEVCSSKVLSYLLFSILIFRAFFLLSFCYWFLIWFHVVKEHTLYDSNSSDCWSLSSTYKRYKRTKQHNQKQQLFSSFISLLIFFSSSSIVSNHNCDLSVSTFSPINFYFMYF